MIISRNLKEVEKDMIKAMIDNADQKWSVLKSTIDDTQVVEMNDGEMGSMRFIINGQDDRQLGETIAEASFNDVDGVLVSVVLNADHENELFELDVWKVDFHKLIKWPEPHNLNHCPVQAARS